MRAQDIMTRPAVTVTPDVPIREAAALLVSHGFTALPVVDADQRMVGIVTETDLLHSRYDTAIAADVRHRLEIYGGPREWSVAVHDGDVTIDAESLDTEAARVVTALAEGVLGVATASVRTGRDLS